MSKKKIFAAMFVLSIMLSAFSFAVESGGIKNSVTNILKFDSLKQHEVVSAKSNEKVKRVAKVARNQSMEFIGTSDANNFDEVIGIVNNSMVTEQARRDIESMDFRFEDLK